MLAETLIMLKKVSESCEDKYITVEDLFLLLSIHARGESANDVELHKNLDWYYKSLQFYDVEGQNPILIPWTKRVEYLIDLGLLECPYGSYIKVNRKNEKEVQILKLEVTEKFKKGILAGQSSKDKLWEFLLSDTVWGEFCEFDGKEYSNRIPSREYRKLGITTTEDVKNLFWKLCDNGNTLSVNSFFNNTLAYIEEFGRDRILTRYLCEYHDLMQVLKAKKKNYA